MEPILIPLLALGAVVSHELCHAVAALLLAEGPVSLHIGREPGVVRLRFGRLRIGIDHRREEADPTREGHVRYVAAPRPRRDAWIAAAGPAGSLVWALACAVALPLVWDAVGWIGRFGIAFGVTYGIATAVVTAVGTDGAAVREALAAERALRELES